MSGLEKKERNEENPLKPAKKKELAITRYQKTAVKKYRGFI